jgi:GH24 family phage-related lysozyme (muramidase)
MSKIKKKKGNDKALIIGLSHGIIESLEGDYREKAYDDGYGTYTIGFGNTYIHDKHSGEIRRVRKGDVLTKSEGILNQRKLINTNYETVMTFLIQNNMDHRISAYGKAALVSFVYNIGMDRFNNSDVASLIKHGRLSKAVKAIKASFITSKGVLSEGLVTRRDIESLLLSLSINNPYKTLLTYRN